MNGTQKTVNNKLLKQNQLFTFEGTKTVKLKKIRH